MSYAQAQNDADNSGPAGDFDGLARCRRCGETYEDHQWWPDKWDEATDMPTDTYWGCADGEEFEELDIDALREAQQERMAEERAGA